MELERIKDAARIHGFLSGYAKIVAAVMEPRFRYTGERWYEYTGTKWRRIEEWGVRDYMTREVYVTLRQKAEEMYRETCMIYQIEKLATRLSTKRGKEEALEELRRVCYEEGFEEELDKGGGVIAFEDEVWDKERGEERKGKPEDMNTVTTGYRYHTYKEMTEGESELMDRYLSKVFMREEDRTTAMRMAKGEEGVYVLEGKSSFLRVMRRMWGEYVYETTIETMFRKTSEQKLKRETKGRIVIHCVGELKKSQMKKMMEGEWNEIRGKVVVMEGSKGIGERGRGEVKVVREGEVEEETVGEVEKLGEKLMVKMMKGEDKIETTSAIQDVSGV